MKHLINNPFTIVKAGDFTDQEILDYWVDMTVENGFEGIVKPKSKTPMILVGGKGSGKTHLLRYFSYPLQKLRYESEGIIDGLSKDKFIGLYLRCGGLNSTRFSGKEIEESIWRKIFPFHFELTLAQLVLDTLLDIFESVDMDIEETLCNDLLNCFDTRPKQPINTLKELFNFLRETQKDIDHNINNYIFTERLDIEILASPGKLIYNFPRVVQKHIPNFKEVLFVYYIDELENLMEYQQEYVQTLIRDRQGNCTIKIGSRKYGIKTLKTLADGEENREDSEFEYVKLDDEFRKQGRKKYKEFISELCIKRLKMHDQIPNIENIGQTMFLNYFETPSNIDELDELDDFTSGKKGKTILKLTSVLKKNQKNIMSSGLAKNVNEIDLIPGLLSRKGLPVLEKACVYEFYKKWSKGKIPLLVIAKEIQNTSDSYIIDKNTQRKFKELISKFKLDLIAQLRKEHNKKQVYAGFDNIIDLSIGFPRSTLAILKHIYKYSVFNGEKPFIKGEISINSQIEGIKQAATWYLNDAQAIGSNKTALRKSIENLSELFKINRYSDKPSERSLKSFSVNITSTSENTQRMITEATQWSLLLKKDRGRNDKNSSRVDDKFSLNPMLSPHWGLPIGDGGTINFSVDTVDCIFSAVSTDEYRKVISEFKRARSAPFLDSEKESQLKFDV